MPSKPKHATILFYDSKPCPQRGLCCWTVPRKGFQHNVHLRTKESLGKSALTNIHVGHHAGRAITRIQDPRPSSPKAVRKANTQAQDRNVWECLLPSRVSLPGTPAVTPSLRSSLVSPSTPAPELTRTTAYSHQARTMRSCSTTAMPRDRQEDHNRTKGPWATHGPDSGQAAKGLSSLGQTGQEVSSDGRTEGISTLGDNIHP